VCSSPKGRPSPVLVAGGTAQEYAAGIPSGPNCQGLQFLPASDYINQQPIGSYALLYGPRAGGGNAGAVAAALDRGPYPKPFTDMDGIYKSLDLLNFGDPGPLRAALVQLDGEIYADYSSVAVTAGQLFLGAVRTQMHTINQQSAPVRIWLSGVGAGGMLNGNDDTHTLHSAIGGVAGGLERRFSPTLLAGVALGWAGGSFATSGISGSGTFNTFVLTPYVRFAPGPWYVEGVIGYNYNWASVSRDLFFINRDLFSGGTARTTSGRPTGNALLSQVETGYSVALNTRTTFTPFATMQGIVILQNGFAETGGGAVDLHVSNQTTSIAVSTLGAEVAYAIPMWRSAPFRLTARLGWAHDFADTERTATAFLEGTPSAALFTVNGASAMRDAAVFGFGVTRSLPGFDLFLRYEGTASSRASVNGGTAGLRFTF
jgi:outer membrane autotransporter protein